MAISKSRSGRGLGNVWSVELDMAENSSIRGGAPAAAVPPGKPRFLAVPSIDTYEKGALGYGGFSSKTAIGAARAAICGEHHSASS